MDNRALFLETANKIGIRICKHSIWQDDKCTWMITEADKKDPRSRKSYDGIAGGTVYRGVAGINLFLIELYKQTKDKNILNVINGATKYANDFVNQLPNNSFGFHSGRVGIAFASMNAGLVLENEDYIEQAKKTLLPLKGNESKDLGIDVIGGAAGAIPILLKMYKELKEEWISEIAINLGEHLINIAHMEPTGWSWFGRNTNIRNLCGYAHGASGIGHAFIELFCFTRSDYYLYAAEQAFLYERQFTNLDKLNWPDFRYSELSGYFIYDKLDDLKNLLRKGDSIKPYDINFMSAWCHGAPGIGLSRLRGYELTDNVKYGEEAMLACNAVLRNTKSGVGNYSLCHGASGNCEILILGSDIFNKVEYRQFAEEIGFEGIKNYEQKGKSWPCGTMGSVSDPSLMLGEAGVGYFLLRLFSIQTPSILAPQIEKNTKNKSITKKYKQLQDKYLAHYFKSTFRVIQNTCSDAHVNFESGLVMGENLSDVSRIFVEISNWIDKQPQKLKEYYKDLFLVDNIRYQMCTTIADYTEELINELRKEDVENIEWDKALIKISDDTNVIETRYDWMNWNGCDISEIKENRVYFVLRRLGKTVMVQNIGSFTYLILLNLKKPSMLDSLLGKLNKFFIGGDKVDKDEVNRMVIHQLIELYIASIITVESSFRQEDYVINTIDKILTDEYECIGVYQKNKFKIQQIIELSKNDLSETDELYRIFQMDRNIELLITLLSNLNVKHYYESYIESYYETKTERTLIYEELINLLDIKYPRRQIYYIVEQ